MSATVSFTRARLSADDHEELRAWLACAPELPLLTAGQEATATPDQLVEHNLRLACRIACKYAGRGVPVSDLIQEASIGLMRAAKTFDASKGRFSTYAVKAVKEYVLRATHNAGSTIRVPVHVLEDRESASALSREQAWVAQNTQSLDAASSGFVHGATVGDGYSTPKAMDEFLADPDADTEAEALANVVQQEQAVIIRQMLAQLDPQAQRVIELRFVRGLSGKQAAALMGVSKQRVHQIEVHARKQLTYLYITNRPPTLRLSKCTCVACMHGDSANCRSRARHRAKVAK